MLEKLRQTRHRLLTEIGVGQVGERVELAGRRSLGFHGGGAGASNQHEVKKRKKKGKANLLRHTLSTFHHNWALFLLD